MELVGTSLSRAMNAMAFLPGAEARGGGDGVVVVGVVEGDESGSESSGGIDCQEQRRVVVEGVVVSVGVKKGW